MGGKVPDEALPPKLTGALRSYALSPEINVSARDSATVEVEVPISPAAIHFNLMVVDKVREQKIIAFIYSFIHFFFFFFFR